MENLIKNLKNRRKQKHVAVMKNVFDRLFNRPDKAEKKNR